MSKEVNFKKGSTASFDQNWQNRSETQYNHWVRGEIQNQIQLAFYNHWTLFSEYLAQDGIKSGRTLEVGCGRGSISSHFAEAGFDCTLLDYSEAVLDTAKKVFTLNGHRAKFIHGDANQLPFPDDQFDVTMSIGLLEHFENVAKPISEQVRILKSGGRFFGYIVPERPDNIQKYFRWINFVLKIIAKATGSKTKTLNKEPIFRSDFDSKHYLKCLKGLPVKNVEVFGMYPLPMISHSPDFPFSLLPKKVEWVLTRIFETTLKTRKLLFGRHPWKCKEELGQAFLLTFQKE